MSPLISDPDTAGLTLGELLTEFFDRGFSQFDDGAAGETRARRWLNQSYWDLCARQEWRWLETDFVGVPPLVIADLRTVVSVTNSTQRYPLRWRDRRDIVATGDWTTPGTPSVWYFSAAATVETYPPTSSDTITVHYVAKPAKLVAAGDRVVVPEEWCDLIVDGAVLRAKKGEDDYDQYVQQFEADYQRMESAELIDQVDGPSFIQMVGDDF